MSCQLRHVKLLVHICMYISLCTIQSANSSLILSEGKYCILIYANEAFGRSEMLTIIQLAHKLRLSARDHGAGCLSGAARTAPTPYTSVVQDVARGPKLALWGFLLGPFKKNFL